MNGILRVYESPPLYYLMNATATHINKTMLKSHVFKTKIKTVVQIYFQAAS